MSYFRCSNCGKFISYLEMRANYYLNSGSVFRFHRCAQEGKIAMEKAMKE